MDNTSNMSNTELFLANKPWLGIFTNIFAFIISFVTTVQPVLQFCVGLTALVIGVLTIIAKLKEFGIIKKK